MNSHAVPRPHTHTHTHTHTDTCKEELIQHTCTHSNIHIPAYENGKKHAVLFACKCMCSACLRVLVRPDTRHHGRKVDANTLCPQRARKKWERTGEVDPTQPQFAKSSSAPRAHCKFSKLERIKCIIMLEYRNVLFRGTVPILSLWIIYYSRFPTICYWKLNRPFYAWIWGDKLLKFEG